MFFHKHNFHPLSPPHSIHHSINIQPYFSHSPSILIFHSKSIPPLGFLFLSSYYHPLSFWYHITSLHTTLYYIIQHHTIPNHQRAHAYITLYHITSHLTTPHFTTSHYYTITHHTTSTRIPHISHHTITHHTRLHYLGKSHIYTTLNTYPHFINTPYSIKVINTCQW